MDFYIAESGIPGAGKGLYTKREFKRGAFIMDVTGPRLTVAEVEANYADSDYLLELNDGSGDCIEVTGYARYANDAEGLTIIPGVRNNSEFCSDDDERMFMRATRKIKAGNEIFTSYGENYWSEARIELNVSVSG
jgi:hypothetical protein